MLYLRYSARLKLILALIAMLGLAGCGSSQPARPDIATPVPLPTVDPANTEMIAAQRNYNFYCAHCHGVEGGGQPRGEGPGTVEWTESLGYHTVPLHNSEGHTWQHPDQVLFEVIKYGIESPLNLYPMSAHGDRLSDDEIWAVIEYMKRFWTDEQRAYQAYLTGQFAEIQPNWETYNLDIYADDAALD